MKTKFIRAVYFKHLILDLINDCNTLKYSSNTQISGLLLSDLLTKLHTLPFDYADSKSKTINEFSFNNLDIIPDGPIKEIYLKKRDLLIALEEKNSGDEGVSQLIDATQNLLTELLAVIKYPPGIERTFGLFFKILIITAGIALSFLSYFFLTNKYKEEKNEYLLIVNADALYFKRLEDLTAINDALQKFYNANGAYPKSSGDWDGILSAFGESKKEWIVDLAPKYIPELPVDPRKSENPRYQYLYKSDGVDFKLIAHQPENMDRYIREHPELVDPARPSWVIGFWTENAKNW